MEIKIEIPRHILEIWNLLTLQFPDYGRGMSIEDLTSSMRLYARLLVDISPELLKAAVLHHIASSKWFPKVSELREAALVLVTRDELSAEEAWGEVRKAIMRYGSCGEFDVQTMSYRLPAFSHPLIAHAVAIIGWKELCFSENAVADRAHFFRIYQQVAEREHADALMLPEVRQIVERLSLSNQLGLSGQLAEVKHE